jgi:hypothetical protein
MKGILVIKINNENMDINKILIDLLFSIDLPFNLISFGSMLHSDEFKIPIQFRLTIYYPY